MSATGKEAVQTMHAHPALPEVVVEAVRVARVTSFLSEAFLPAGVCKDPEGYGFHG
jgi:pantoate kinase